MVTCNSTVVRPEKTHAAIACLCCRFRPFLGSQRQLHFVRYDLAEL